MNDERLKQIRGHIDRRAPRCCDIGSLGQGQHREGCPEEVAQDALALLDEVKRLRTAVHEAFREGHYLGNRSPVESGAKRWAKVDLDWSESDSKEGLDA